MRTLWRWLACANWGVLLYVAMLLFVESWYWIDREFTNRSRNGFDAVRGVVLAAGAVAYGAWRVWSWHPAFQAEYREWLLATPWNGLAPLPLGPVRWMWRDLAVVAALFAWANFNPALSPIYLPLLAVVAYLTMLTGTFLQPGLWRYFYGSIFGWGLIVSYWPRPYIALMLALVLYAFAFLGIRRALALLPRDEAGFDAKSSWRAFGGVPTSSDGEEQWLGWPHDSLAPGDRAFNVNWVHGLLLSLAAGWLFHAALSLFAFYAATDSNWRATTIFEDLRQGARLDAAAAQQILANTQRLQIARASSEMRGFAFVVVGLAGLLTAAWRFSSYRLGYRSPINFWGRLFTGRWIIPDYDRFFVAPLAILAILGLGGKSLETGWLPADVAGPLTLTCILLIAFNLGPRQLTLHCASPARLVPHTKSREKTKFVQI